MLWEGIGFTLVDPGGNHSRWRSRCEAASTLANALVAAAIALQLDLGLDAVAAGLATAPVIPGRFERVLSGQPFEVVVDYAHTPASIEEAVSAARRLTDGAVVVVFGAGGDRDRAKRPLMGQAASAADRVVVTSDNPRSEDPGAIIAEVLAGVGTRVGWAVEPDRRLAIRHAIADSSARGRHPRPGQGARAGTGTRRRDPPVRRSAGGGGGARCARISAPRGTCRVFRREPAR